MGAPSSQQKKGTVERSLCRNEIQYGFHWTTRDFLMDINHKGAPIVTMFVLQNGELQCYHLSFTKLSS